MSKNKRTSKNTITSTASDLAHQASQTRSLAHWRNVGREVERIRTLLFREAMHVDRAEDLAPILADLLLGNIVPLENAAE